MRMPSHRWFNQPAALDSARGAGTIGGNTLTSTAPSDLNSVHTNSAPVHTDLAPVHGDLVAVHTDLAPVPYRLCAGQLNNTVRRRKRSGCSDGRPGVFTPCYSRSVKLGILTCGGFRLRNLRLRDGSYQFDKGDRFGAADLAALSREAPNLPRYAVRAGAAKLLAGPAEMGYTG